MTRRKAILAGALVSVLVVAAVAIALLRSNGEPPADAFTTEISADAAVDANSSRIVDLLLSDGGFHAPLVSSALPIYDATPSSPRERVICTNTEWDCPFDGLKVPIPRDARPNTGFDAAMVVVDQSAGKVYEFWRLQQTDTGWQTSYGSVLDVDETEWLSGASGSGAPLMSGTIRLSEIARAQIPHALSLRSKHSCAETIREPAVKTNGTSRDKDCIPQGTRVRLDPAVSLSSLDLTPAELAIATALQRYGGYVTGTGNAALSVAFERDPQSGSGFVGSTYSRAGLEWDDEEITGIPWHRLEILAEPR